jgi:hypothetical protein
LGQFNYFFRNFANLAPQLYDDREAYFDLMSIQILKTFWDLKFQNQLSNDLI